MSRKLQEIGVERFSKKVPNVNAFSCHGVQSILTGGKVRHETESPVRTFGIDLIDFLRCMEIISKSIW